jgi:hypothetical protein
MLWFSLRLPCVKPRLNCLGPSASLWAGCGCANVNRKDKGR